MTNELTTEPTVRSPAAERMARSRQRRRDGLRCITIDLYEREIDGLVARGLLDRNARRDRLEVILALYRFLGQALNV
jgi:hypothetical protein